MHQYLQRYVNPMALRIQNADSRSSEKYRRPWEGDYFRDSIQLFNYIHIRDWNLTLEQCDKVGTNIFALYLFL